jgi:hypothetical protein
VSGTADGRARPVLPGLELANLVSVQELSRE